MADDLFVEIPRNAENLSLPSPELVNFYKEIERRTLWIDGEIDIGCLEIERYILNFNKEDVGKPVEERTPIKLLFFTPGGSIDVNNSLIALIQMSKTPVWGVNMGAAHSAGAFVYLACQYRLAMPGSVFLLHQGTAEMSGTHEQVRQVTNEYQRQIAELVEYVEKRTKIPHAKLTREIKKEWFIEAEEALSYGICDKIVTSIDEIL